MNGVINKGYSRLLLTFVYFNCQQEIWEILNTSFPVNRRVHLCGITFQFHLVSCWGTNCKVQECNYLEVGVNFFST